MRAHADPLILDVDSTEQSALLAPNAPTRAQTCWNGTKTAAYYTAQTALHTADFMRIALVTQALTGRWLYQLFLELELYDVAPSLDTQQTWLGWPIIASAVIAAGACKAFNHFAKKAYLLQDYLFAVFSSSILYFILDTLSDSGAVGAMPLWAFIVTSVFVPVVSAISAKLVVPDSAKELIVKPSQYSEENFPSYPNATKKEMFLNFSAGLGYGANLAVLFWVLNREINQKTVGMEFYQVLLTVAFTGIYTVAGTQLTKYPKPFHGFIAASKAIRDGSLAYASLSGIAFHSLMYAAKCVDDPCWDPMVSGHLRNVFIPISIIIGLFSAATTLFHYKANHEANENIIQRAGEAKEKVSSCFGATTGALTSCTGAIFSKLQQCCNGNEADEDSVTIEGNHSTERGTSFLNNTSV